jgi:hypothetical protein
MMSAYSYNRLFAIPFILFLLFGLFFVMNIVLASVYSNYKRGLETRATSFTQSREKSLDIAFDLLTRDNRQRNGTYSSQCAGTRRKFHPIMCLILYINIGAGSSKRGAGGGVDGISVQVFRDLVHELSEYGTNVPSASGPTGFTTDPEAAGAICAQFVLSMLTFC